MAHSNAVVLDSLAMKALLTTIRRKSTPQRTYVEHCDRLCAMLAEEALARLPGTAYDVPVETPCGTLTTGSAVVVPERDICLVDIMRSGAILQEAVRRVVPGRRRRRSSSSATRRPRSPCSCTRSPPKIEAMNVLLCDPMLATGGSALTAIKVLKDAGVPEERITFANVVSCPEGLANLKKHAPKVVVVTSAVDEGLDARSASSGPRRLRRPRYGTAGYDAGLGLSWTGDDDEKRTAWRGRAWRADARRASWRRDGGPRGVRRSRESPVPVGLG
ncbi:hypothetical protein JL722_14211 [Aureococcus anophagefferens]|nr:hypothetical protein JL722_14211 [Aureococcus anophagefferens]